jgi:hypothetical protein
MFGFFFILNSFSNYKIFMPKYPQKFTILRSQILSVISEAIVNRGHCIKKD